MMFINLFKADGNWLKTENQFSLHDDLSQFQLMLGGI